MSLREEQVKFIRENFSLFNQTLRELAVIPAPSHHEEKRVEYCTKFLENAGAKGVYTDEALNVLYPYRCEDTEEIFVLCAHTDVVFPDTDALPLIEDEDLLHCPGIGDDTVNAVLVMMLAKYVAQYQPETKCGILFALVSCEEGLGNLKGTRKLMEVYKERVTNFVSLDASFGGFSIDCVGSTRYEITVTEQGGHSWGDFGRRNAIAGLSRLICDLYDIPLPKMEGTRTTFNVGGISGGISVNTIAPKASVLYEYRSDSYPCIQYMKEQFDSVIEKARDYCTEIDVKVLGERPCSNVDPEKQNALLEKLLKAYHTLTESKPRLSKSSTDCNIPLSIGIPAIATGAAVYRNIHTRSEYLQKNSLENALNFVFSLFNLYLK